MKNILKISLGLALTTAAFASEFEVNAEQNKLVTYREMACQTDFNSDIADMVDNPNDYVPVTSLKAVAKQRDLFVEKCGELNEHVKYLQNQLAIQKEEQLRIADAFMNQQSKPGMFSHVIGEIYSLAVRDIATISYKLVVNALFSIADASLSLFSRALLRV